jgi:hypothetical protein
MTRARPETVIRLGIAKLMRQIGFDVWDMEQNRPTRQTPGFSDLVCVGHGRVLFVEVKTEKGRLSGYQEIFGESIQRNGGDYLVWRSTVEAWDWLVEQGIIEEAA